MKGGGDTFASTNKWLDTLSTFWFGWGYSFIQSIGSEQSERRIVDAGTTSTGIC
jgi:hypothetical protein